jgi:hypothetical protein
MAWRVAAWYSACFRKVTAGGNYPERTVHTGSVTKAL